MLEVTDAWHIDYKNKRRSDGYVVYWFKFYNRSVTDMRHINYKFNKKSDTYITQ